MAGTISPLWSAELAHAHALAHWAFGPSKLLEQVTQEALEKVMPGLLSGTESMCFGLSEPNGLNASMIKTKATRDGDGWRINGRKIWTTNAPIADYCDIRSDRLGPSGAKKGELRPLSLLPRRLGFTVQQLSNCWPRGWR